MIRGFKLATFGLALALAGQISIATPAAWADDHPGKGKGKGNSQKMQQGGRHDGTGGGPYVNIEIDFGTADRRMIHDYYGDVARYGRCPPGLAKKQNGCMPPGQAKKWALGRPLPRDVIFYPLPAELLLRVSPPPQGYRYVRVASDILMIAAGTGMVVAAIEDLARL